MMHPSGPSNARIMIVGEAPTADDFRRGQPFSDSAGWELDKMLNEAGIMRSQCFVTNVCQECPPKNNRGESDIGEWLVDLKYAPKPDNPRYKNKEWTPWKGRWCNPAVVQGYEQLVKHISLVRPALIIALGNTPLLALTGKWGIGKWRGSELSGEVDGHSFKVVPALPPDAVRRDWKTRSITVHDLRRAKRESEAGPYPVKNYPRIIRPNFVAVCKWFAQVQQKLMQGPVEASTDIETRAGHISCWGCHIPGLPTICIPFMCVENPEGYWTENEEVYIVHRIRALVSQPLFRIVGQNWGYDAQYHYRHWLVVAPVFWDTMVAQHCIFPGMPKGLDYLHSLYGEHYVYWKDDGKLWDPSIPEEQAWNYNCDDTEKTFEVFSRQREVIEANDRLRRVWDFQTNTLAPLLFKAMCRGIRADVGNKARLSSELDAEIKVREEWLQRTLGHPLNFRSPVQMKKFFYEDLAQRPVFDRKARGEVKITTNDEALETIAKREPLLLPVVTKIRELRSIGVFKSTFVDARLDRDQRIRCSYNIGGTVTFRLSSSENAFGSGLNLQNIPSGNEDDDPGALILPNIRKLFIPDPGQIMFDIDLKNADFYTVVWESDDELFRLALEAGVDMHLLNAAALFPVAAECTLERLQDKDFVKYAKAKYAKPRSFAKIWCHGTDYGGGDRTMAANAGITQAENKKLREKWFGEHPGIKRWHERTEKQIKTHHWVENRFGYRWTCFDRVDGVLPEALAWIPQSTTGCVINRAWAKLDTEFTRRQDGEVLIQVHDSLVGQYAAASHDWFLQNIQEIATVVVPYDRPMVIPVGVKTSAASWGHCG